MTDHRMVVSVPTCPFPWRRRAKFPAQLQRKAPRRANPDDLQDFRKTLPSARVERSRERRASVVVIVFFCVSRWWCLSAVALVHVAVATRVRLSEETLMVERLHRPDY